MVDIKAKNFQSIIDAELQIDGFTLLVGETSAGKSALLRSLTASTCNKYRSGYVRYGEKELETEFGADGRVFKTRKSEGGGTTMELDDVTFTKMGRDVPNDIKEFLNLGIMEVNDTKFNLNIHPQFQKPLLLEFSQKKVMEILSTSKGITDLKNAQSLITSRRSEVKGAITATDQLRADVARTLDESKSLMEKIEPHFKVFQHKYEQYKQMNTHLERLNTMSELIAQRKNLNVHIGKIETFLSKSNELTNTLDAEKARLDSLSSLQRHSDDKKHIESEINRLERSISILKDIVSKDADIYESNGRLTMLNKLSQSVTEHRNLGVEVERLTVKIGKLTKVAETGDKLSWLKNRSESLARLSEHLTSLNDLRKKIKDLDVVVSEGRCPICGNLINEHK